VLVLAAGVRALRFGGPLGWSHSDEANVALPATQVLGGTFPVHHLGVEYVVRYIRIRPAAPAPTWAIAEIEVFGSP
jgi:hypothetical protein